MKTWMTAILFLLLVPISTAELNVRLISYNADTTESRILLQNTGQTDYTNLKILIDNMTTDLSGGVLKSKTGWLLAKLVQPGTHQIRIVAGEQVIIEQQLIFPEAAKHIESYVAPVVTGTSEKKDNSWIYVVIGAAITIAVLLMIYGLKRAHKAPKGRYPDQLRRR
ncbi:MAG: hypothetical protein V1837_08210 [Candidatus Woesearchaeota archaeon]